MHLFISIINWTHDSCKFIIIEKKQNSYTKRKERKVT